MGSHQLLAEYLHHLAQQIDVCSLELLAEVLQVLNPDRAPPPEFPRISLRMTRWSPRSTTFNYFRGRYSAGEQQDDRVPGRDTSHVATG